MNVNFNTAVFAIFFVAMFGFGFIDAKRSPGSSCTRNYQCSVGKCVKRDNLLCGIGSMYT